MKISKEVEKAYQLALEAQASAYAPYSHFKVGACWKVAGEESAYFSGFNIENASYGATVCAERTALYQLMTKTQKKAELEFLVVVTATKPASPPCGLCLQVMSEFCSPDMPVYLANDVSIERVLRFSDFLPQPFDLLQKS